MARSNECLICCTPTDTDGCTDVLVNNNVTAYFVINKLLEISQSNFVEWLCKGKNPSEWISFCRKCFDAVGDAQKIFSQLLQLEIKWKLAKLKVEKSIHENYKWEGNYEKEYSISNVIRRETFKRCELGAAVGDIKIESNLNTRHVAGGIKLDCDDNEYVYNSDSELWFPHMEEGDVKHLTAIDKDAKIIPEIKTKSLRKSKHSKKKSKSLRKLHKINRKSKTKMKMEYLDNDAKEKLDSTANTRRSGRAITRIKYNQDLQDESEDETIPKSHKHELDETEEASDYDPGADGENYDEDNNCDGGKSSDSRKITDTGEYSCKFCSKTFKTLNYAKSHELKTHVKTHGCKECKKEYSNYHNLRNHMDINHSSSENKTLMMPYECSQCESFFKTENLLQLHTKQAHEGVEKAYVCQDCGKAFNLHRQLRRHELTVHTKDRPFHCSQCRFATDTEGKLKRHVFVVHESKNPVPCPECNKDLKCQYRLKTHIEMVHKKQKNFVCEHCSASFTQMSSLKYHQIGQHDIVFEDLPISLKCDPCGKIFSNPKMLQKHTLSVHEKKYLFHCPICNAGRQTKGLIDKHIILAHTNKRPFACSLCDKSYISKGKLDDHFRTHTGEKPFVCKLCQAAFSCKKYLEAHDKIHTTEKNFLCDLCPKRFPNAQYLGHHKWYVHQRQKSKMPPKQIVDKSLLEAVANSGGYKKTQTLLSSISDTNTNENSNNIPPVVSDKTDNSIFSG